MLSNLADREVTVKEVEATRLSNSEVDNHDCSHLCNRQLWIINTPSILFARPNPQCRGLIVNCSHLTIFFFFCNLYGRTWLSLVSLHLNFLSFIFLSKINSRPFTSFVDFHINSHFERIFVNNFLVKHLFGGTRSVDSRRLRLQQQEINKSPPRVLATTTPTAAQCESSAP